MDIINLVLAGTVIVFTSVSARILGVRMRRRIRRGLGKKATDVELTSLDTWINVYDAEERDRGGKISRKLNMPQQRQGTRDCAGWQGGLAIERVTKTKVKIPFLGCAISPGRGLPPKVDIRGSENEQNKQNPVADSGPAFFFLRHKVLNQA